MMVMDTKTTSKTSSLKALLLRAWRERWSDIQWGINIKTVLPRGVSGDVYNLADCILQQAVIGTGTNHLVLSYLRHSLSSQLVSHAAVLQRLSKYRDFEKVHCILSLLEFLEKMLPGITCCGKPEETVLATAVLATVNWLLSIFIAYSAKNTSEQRQVVETVTYLLQKILNDEFYQSLICLARYNDSELFTDTRAKCVDVFHNISDGTKNLIKLLETIDVNVLTLPTKTSTTWPGSLIQCWLSIRLALEPGTSSSSLCSQLRLIAKLKNYNQSRLFAELIRGSLLALHDVSQTVYESQWGAFTFIKIPTLITEIVQSKCSDDNTRTQSNLNINSTVVNAVELLLQHSPLLNAMDINNSCSTLECLLGELAKVNLLSENNVKILLEKRALSTLPPVNMKLDSGPATAGIPKVIICAEPTLAGILKTLSADYHKIQDPLLGMLHQVLTGKSFELILAVATVQGQLRTLVVRLIRFNECSKCGGDKQRAQLFDISFLMLVAIVQNYGCGTILENDSNSGDSLFENWIRNCMVERQKPKAAEQILRLGDAAIVENLLQQFNSGESEFKLVNIKWQEILFNMPGVMREVLVAWEQGALVAADVKRILDAVRGSMCCVSLAAAAWLCAYMRTAPQENILKPMNMVQQLLAPPAVEEDSLRERWQLTSEIIRRMQRDIQLLPVQIKNLTTQNQHNQFVSRQPAIEQFHSAWKMAIERGWLDHTTAKLMHCLLETAGARWMVNSIVQELLNLRYTDPLARGIDVALALFHVDIAQCTFELIAHILPQTLFNNVQAVTLMEPHLSALATLTSQSLYLALEFVTLNEHHLNPNESNAIVAPPNAKIPKLSFKEDDGFGENAVSMNSKTQLTIALKQLLSLCESIVHSGCITQQTYFTFYLLQNLVNVDNSIGSLRTVLGCMPATLIANLLRTLPELFNYKLLVHLHNLETTTGRISMAKDVCNFRNHQLRSDNGN